MNPSFSRVSTCAYRAYLKKIGVCMYDHVKNML